MLTTTKRINQILFPLVEQLGSGVSRMLEVYDKSCFKFSLTLSE